MSRLGDGAPGMALGEEIRVLPMVGGQLLHGRVVGRTDQRDPRSRWARAVVLPFVGPWIDGARVWMISGIPEHRDPVTVYEGRLLLTELPGEVDLVDVSLLADEPRRAALRAAARRPVLLLRPGKVSSGTTSLDLSSTGCRVTVPDHQELSVGQMLQVAVDLDTGNSVWADGQVVRVDEAASVAALRFTRMDPADQERLDRHVLAALSPRPRSFGTQA